MSIKFFHASPYRLTVGTVLEPGVKAPNYEESDEGYIYITTSPVPHHTVVYRAAADKWYVYEVRPQGQLSMGRWDDARCESAVIVKCVGNARGIAKAKCRKKDRGVIAITGNYERYKVREGSYVEPRTMPPKTKGRGSYAACLKEQEVVAASAEGVRRMMTSNITLKERAALYTKLGIKLPTWLQKEV